MTSLTTPDIPDEVYLEEHGIPGTLGAPAGEILAERMPDILDSAMWIESPSRGIDLHVGFRARFTVAETSIHTLRVQAASVFRVWVDEDVVVHGPLRYTPAVPEYHELELVLIAGEHTLCIEAHHEGIMHRTTAPVPAFVMASASNASGSVELDWRARELSHYGRTGLRVSPLLGWMETHTTPGGDRWRGLPDDDAGWKSVVPASDAQDVLGVPIASQMRLPQWPLLPMAATQTGFYSDTFAGYDLDDPASQFLLADDSPAASAPLDGQWFRYDLGCVRIGSVELEVELEHAGTVIVGYAERLAPDGRPSPIVAMSAGPTRMIQQFAVGKGRTRIVPLQSLGGRYIEVRVETAGNVHILDAGFRERDYLGEPTGSFQSDDPVLDTIWATGIRTLRSSTEDAVVDSVRERGEWLGDVVSAAHQIMQAGWSDTIPIRRALLHAAAGARSDGLVSGCGPGELIYLGTYAAQWTQACLHVAATEGSDGILRELLDSARANMAAILASVNPDGSTTLPWGFVDWGYAAPTTGPDVAVLAHVVMSLRQWIVWLERIGLEGEASAWTKEYERLADLLRPIIRSSASPYHAHVLGYHAGVVDAAAAVPHIIDRFENGFPFDLAAARLKNPTKADRTAVTPYFTNYSMPILLEAGHGELVRDLWHRGWGWMLQNGATTWWEVFDDRWSRCHAWSGAPTWQLSRYALGLRPSGETGETTLTVSTLGLARVAGKVPVRGGGIASVSWEREGDVVRYTVASTAPLEIRFRGQLHLITDKPTRFTLTRTIGDVYA